SYGGATSEELPSGQALITVVDAPRQIERSYLTRDGDTRTVKYELPGAALFRGLVRVNEGRFEGRFRVPMDISYGASAATIIAYAWSEQNGVLQEQIGARSELFIRGSRSDIQDRDGPLITVYWDGRPLYDQDALPVAARLEVELKDPLGINLTGEVGHAIRIWIDDESSAQVMDQLFNYDIGSDTTGGFTFDLDPGLTGRHEITIEAWDSANNKTVTTIVLYLALSEQLAVDGLFNFPNPFQDQTEFVYTLSVPAEIAITVYTLNGVKVVELFSMGEQSSGFQRLFWNGRDAYQDRIANGTYLYQFRAETLDGAIITRWGRLARLR
ncbi:MAG: T9SS type A sorting domain-containing protein, partial [Candidatus Marinimicrobia bacterium]|nr:T9SS type A sorting domain-containing protein [Candidatus Neomarinimicrobiota bacterium]